MTLTPSSTRSPMTSIEPPGRHSSAGWNTSRTLPGSRSACWARASPAPSRMVVCTSWPQAWQTPGTVER